jgi:hypothetical protein
VPGGEGRAEGKRLGLAVHEREREREILKESYGIIKRTVGHSHKKHADTELI